MFLGKFVVRLRRVRRDAYDLSTSRLIFGPMVTHRAKLLRAHRRVITGIKKQHDRSAAMIAERPVASVAVSQCEVRSKLSGFHRRALPIVSTSALFCFRYHI